MRRIVLASESPRRRELLATTNINFIAKSSSIDETLDLSNGLFKAIEQLALDKAKAVQHAYPEDIILGADTVVILEKKILGKPETEEEAREMLKALSGKKHHVVTGVAILNGEEVNKFHEISEVLFYELDDEIIDWYISTRESLDKAGGYGIQGSGAILVKSIKGDYNNIVGLPLAKTYRELLPLIAM